ncbi:MAG: sigma-54-dependent Fis family transcriptional regulator [Planctomycetes bacterium]|nr:sigma-54-dependent Fis family transcriptional regulator [Planctomycetota bacterium]
MPDLAPVNCLVVDDEPSIRHLFDQLVATDTIQITTAGAAAEAHVHLQRHPCDVAFVDLTLPGEDGLHLLETIKHQHPDVEVVIVTGHASVESAVQAMKLGAYDYLTKPFGLSEIRIVLERLRKMQRLKIQNRLLTGQLKDRYRLGSLVGLTPAMEEIDQVIRKVSQEECTVLIQGESGTGKELIARAIHFNSRRAAKPFVTVDCGAIPSTLIESELYGHEKGSFTGAHAKKAGLFAVADGGTLLLDEIGEVPIDVQPTLLRAIETKKIRPVGGTGMLDVNVRILSSTNRDLEADVKSGRFRADLFYRLNVVSVLVPPLRQRKDDIPLLVDHFIQHFSKLGYRNVRAVSREALILLLRYDWPGNVRELEHVIERAFALGHGPQIEVGDLPAAVSASVQEKSRRYGPPPGKHKSLAEIERETILRVLTEQHGDTKATADLLEIDRSTLYRKLKKYRVDPKALGAPPDGNTPPEKGQ